MAISTIRPLYPMSSLANDLFLVNLRWPCPHFWLMFQGTVAYYLLLDNRFRVSSGYLGAEFQESVVCVSLTNFFYASFFHVFITFILSFIYKEAFVCLYAMDIYLKIELLK